MRSRQRSRTSHNRTRYGAFDFPIAHMPYEATEVYRSPDTYLESLCECQRFFECLDLRARTTFRDIEEQLLSTGELSISARL